MYNKFTGKEENQEGNIKSKQKRNKLEDEMNSESTNIEKKE